MSNLRMFTSIISFTAICFTVFTTFLQLTTVVYATHNNFAIKIYSTIAANYVEENVIFSPISIHTGVAMAWFGANGKTADEMRRCLQLSGHTFNQIAKHYSDFLRNVMKESQTALNLSMANRIYVSENLHMKPSYAHNAMQVFQTVPEKISFSDSKAATEEINSWVHQHTGGQIDKLLSASAVTPDTSALLVNAIYMKAHWEKGFKSLYTTWANFTVSSKRKVSVRMMRLWGKYRYAELPELDATAFAMRYQNSAVNMLIVLPNKSDGLKSLVRKLSALKHGLNSLTSRMSWQQLEVSLPRFKFNFDIDLKYPLRKLGMATMFSSHADFSRLFTTEARISEAQHMAYIKVDEDGTEATAVTSVMVTARTVGNFKHQKLRFHADHPFFFAIGSTHATYFAGHVATFEKMEQY